MNSERLFIVHMVWELVELCAEKRGRCPQVNMEDFRNALDCLLGNRPKESYASQRGLRERNHLLTITRGEDDEITDIVITPPTFRCPEFRLMVGSREDWEDHLPDCLRQQAKMRTLGLIA